MNLSPHYLDAICEAVTNRLRAETAPLTFDVRVRVANIPENVDLTAFLQAAEKGVKQSLDETGASLYRGAFRPKQDPGDFGAPPSGQCEAPAPSEDRAACPADAFADEVNARVEEREDCAVELEEHALGLLRSPGGKEAQSKAEVYADAASFLRENA